MLSSHRSVKWAVTAIAAVASMMLVSAAVQAAIINVPGDQPTIQAGIDAAVNGDEVVVAIGTYVELINFSGKAITVRSTDPNDPVVVMATIIDGNGLGSVVTCTLGEGLNTVLSGFVITGGGGPLVTGGGMNNFASSPTVTNCTFTGNSSLFGGGMYNCCQASPTVTNCTFTGNTAKGNGGAIYNTGIASSPTVTNCTFTGNSSFFGGGMYNCCQANPTVTNCTFSGNIANVNGGAMYNTGSDLTVTDCTFRSNMAEGTSNNTGGGGMFNDGGNATVTGCTFDGNTAIQSGGAMLNLFANLTVTDCVFTGNIALGVSSDGGGAMFTFVEPKTDVLLVNCDFSESQGLLGGAVCFAAFESDIDPITLINCAFTNNTAVGSSLGGRGGALFTQDVVAILIDCTFETNQAIAAPRNPSRGGGIINIVGGSSMLINCTMSGNTASLGGAIYIEGALSSFSLLNSTLSENTAVESGGGIWTEGNSGAIANSILWANSDAGGQDESAQVHADGPVFVDYSCIEGLRSFPGVGNIDADPLFVDPVSGDYHLSPGSPCIDAADNTAVPKGIVTDLDGGPRFVDDLGTPDTGNADCVNPIVDMGAYEFLPFPSPPGDLNGDGVVGIIDLLMLLASWGDCPALPEQCSADLNYDCVVGITDLLTLLANWG